jgi:hypothetical protein
VSEQLSIDAVASEAARERAIQRVDQAAEPEWKDYAYEAACEAANLWSTFTTDEAEQLLPIGTEPPHEPRAWGPVMRRVAADGVIEPTNEWRLTTKIVAHRRPKRVWRSLR